MHEVSEAGTDKLGLVRNFVVFMHKDLPAVNWVVCWIRDSVVMLNLMEKVLDRLMHLDRDH